jgi:protein SCO1/2
VCLTGNAPQIQEAQKAFRIYAKKAKPDGTTTEYLMDHSSLIYFLDRQGRCIAFFSHTTPSAQISQQIKNIIEQEAQS